MIFGTDFLSTITETATQSDRSNGKMEGGGKLKGNSSDPDDLYYTTWAKYLSRFVTEYENEGIKTLGEHR